MEEELSGEEHGIGDKVQEDGEVSCTVGDSMGDTLQEDVSGMDEESTLIPDAIWIAPLEVDPSGSTVE